MINTRTSDLLATDLANARLTLKAPELVRLLRNCHDALARWTSADVYGAALADGTQVQLLTEARALIVEIKG
jgi:hypothetical protein